MTTCDNSFTLVAAVAVAVAVVCLAYTRDNGCWWCICEHADPPPRIISVSLASWRRSCDRRQFTGILCVKFLSLFAVSIVASVCEAGGHIWRQFFWFRYSYSVWVWWAQLTWSPLGLCKGILEMLALLQLRYAERVLALNINFKVTCLRKLWWTVLDCYIFSFLVNVSNIATFRCAWLRRFFSMQWNRVHWNSRVRCTRDCLSISVRIFQNEHCPRSITNSVTISSAVEHPFKRVIVARDRRAWVLMISECWTR